MEIICKNCDQLKDKSDIVIYNNRVTNVDERPNYTSTILANLTNV